MNVPAVPSPVSQLWHWHGAHEFDRRAPPYLVERANNQHEAARAARAPLPDLLVGVAEGEVREIAGRMTRFAPRRRFEHKLAARFDVIGRHEDAAKLRACRCHANFMLRDRDARLIPIFDAKCRRPRFCPDEAREEAVRTVKRDLPRVRAWLAPQGRRRRGFFVTVSPPLVPRGRLAWANRMLFEVLDKWRRRKAGQSIKLARAVLEAPLSRRGLWHPHLHVVIGVEGAFNFNQVRPALNALLRESFPVIAGDVLRRSSGEVMCVERLRYAPDAVRELTRQNKKGQTLRRLDCDPSRDVACLSDGSELTVAEVLKAMKSGELVWGYKLRDPSGRERRIAAVHHAPGADRGRDVIVFAGGAGEMPLGKLCDLVARDELEWSGEPMSFQIDFEELDRETYKFTQAYRELVKYMMKHTEPKVSDEAPLPSEDPEGSFGVWSEPPGLLELPDNALKEWCEAGDGFRRSRAYGELHGVGDDAPSEAEFSGQRPVGTAHYDATRGNYEMHLNGRRFWAGEEATRGPVNLIPANRSAVNKADKSADRFGVDREADNLAEQKMGTDPPSPPRRCFYRSEAGWGYDDVGPRRGDGSSYAGMFTPGWNKKR